MWPFLAMLLVYCILIIYMVKYRSVSDKPVSPYECSVQQIGDLITIFFFSFRAWLISITTYLCFKYMISINTQIAMPG